MIRGLKQPESGRTLDPTALVTKESGKTALGADSKIRPPRSEAHWASSEMPAMVTLPVKPLSIKESGPFRALDVKPCAVVIGSHGDTMSFNFTVVLPEGANVDVQCILSGLSQPWPLAGIEQLAGRPSWPDGHVRLHLDQESTRGVSVTKAGQEVTVTLNTCASAADHELAVQLVSQFMATANLLVQPEDTDEPLSAEVFRARYGPAWVSDQTKAGPTALSAFMEFKGEVTTVPGPVRSWHLSPETLVQLVAAGPPEELHLRILADIRRVQYFDIGDAFEAGFLRLDTGETIATFAPGLRYLLPKVGTVALVDESGREPLLLSWEDFMASVESAFLDAGQAIISAVDEEHWERLREGAKPLAGAFGPDGAAQAVPIEAPQDEKTPSPWWKFW